MKKIKNYIIRQSNIMLDFITELFIKKQYGTVMVIVKDSFGKPIHKACVLFNNKIVYTNESGLAVFYKVRYGIKNGFVSIK